MGAVPPLCKHKHDADRVVRGPCDGTGEGSIQSLKRLMPILKLLQVPAYGLHAQMQQRQRLKNLERSAAVPQLPPGS